MDDETHTASPDVNSAAVSAGIKYPVRVSPELAGLLKPNGFMADLGIRYAERLTAVLEILRTSFLPKDNGAGERLPKGRCVIPFTFANGPYIREETVNIKAALSDVDGKPEILLSLINHEE